MMAPHSLLSARDLCAWYGGAQVLRGVDLDVRRGEAVALMGSNGAGKSSTLKALIGIGPRRSGSIGFMGQDVSHARSYEAARQGLGFVPEERRIFTELTVLENLEVGRQPPRRWPDGSAATAWTIERVFTLFPALADMRHRRGAQMSGGEQQMLSIGRTLMGNPFVLLLDEPSEGVAPIIVEQLAGMLLELKAHGVSVLLSEQNLQFSARVCDRAYLLHKGEIQWQGSMRELESGSGAGALHPGMGLGLA